MCRNPKDVCVSLQHHATNKPLFEYEGNFSDMLRFFAEGRCEIWQEDEALHADDCIAQYLFCYVEEHAMNIKPAELDQRLQSTKPYQKQALVLPGETAVYIY